MLELYPELGALADHVGAAWLLRGGATMEPDFHKPNAGTDGLPLFPEKKHARKSDPETSHEGARKVSVRANSHKARLLVAYLDVGGEATADQAGIVAELEHTGYWKRVSDLLADRLLEDTGRKHRGVRSGAEQRVLRLTEKGRKLAVRFRVRGAK